jgi:hypothetical protein
MKPVKRLVLTITLTLMVMSLMTGNAQAAGCDDEDSLMVSIESADYLDLDADQVEDDILTEFTIRIPDGDWSFGVTYIWCEVELPSGLTFVCELLVIGTYSSLGLTLGWYNTAIESGWYTFRVYADTFGNNAPDPGWDTLVFDPPTDGDTGPPLIEIIEVTTE